MSSKKTWENISIQLFLILKKKIYLKFGRAEKRDCRIKSWEEYHQRQEMIKEMIIDIDDKLETHEELIGKG